jgi:signal peptidase I
MDQIAATPTALPLGRPVRRRIVRRVLPVAALALATVWLVAHKNVTQYNVTSGSMEPTLQVGQRVAVVSAAGPQVGDIVVFHPPTGARPQDPVCGTGAQGAGQAQPCDLSVPQESGQVFVKRVVAGPGDELSLVDGHVVLDGIRQDEPYISPCAGQAGCSFHTSITVPAGEYYLLGDNRGVSDDSRFWGPVPRGWIIGTVVRCALLDTVCHRVR